MWGNCSNDVGEDGKHDFSTCQGLAIDSENNILKHFKIIGKTMLKYLVSLYYKKISIQDE